MVEELISPIHMAAKRTLRGALQGTRSEEWLLHTSYK